MPGGAAGESGVLPIARAYLTVCAVGVLVMYPMNIFRSALQGMGNTVMPMVSGIAEMVLRVGCAMLLPPLIGHYGVYFGEVAAWSSAVVILMGTYFIIMARHKKKGATLRKT